MSRILVSAICAVASPDPKYGFLHQQSPPVQTMFEMEYVRGSAVDHGVRRMEFQTLTVDDLGKAGLFYGDVLGGEELRFCTGGESQEWCTPEGYVRFHGDEHDRAMFALDEVPQRPDISSAGDMEVQSRFFVLRNSMVQLLSFNKRGVASEPWLLRDSRTSPTYITNAHVCLWIEDGVDANDFVRDVESRSHALGLDDVKFNRPYPQSSEDDRANVPADKFANCAQDGIWEGNCAAYFKGASGEQMEIYAIEGAFKQNVGRSFCDRGGANRAFLSSDCEGHAYCDAPQRPHLSQRLHGMFQQGFRTRDLNAAVGFYTEVLGGDLIARPSQGTALMQSDAFQWQIFANETFEAWRFAEEHGISRAEALQRFAVPDISPTGKDRLDLMFILFDNFVVEPLEYTAGLTFGATGYDPALNHSSSLAYVGTFAASFGVGDATMPEYMDSLQAKLQRQGYLSVKAPVAFAGFPMGHPYSGLEYTYAKGPDGESLAFVRLAGQFKEQVRKAYESCSTVSTLFPETDAFANGDMTSFCEPFEVPVVEL